MYRLGEGDEDDISISVSSMGRPCGWQAALLDAEVPSTSEVVLPPLLSEITAAAASCCACSGCIPTPLAATAASPDVVVVVGMVGRTSRQLSLIGETNSPTIVLSQTKLLLFR